MLQSFIQHRLLCIESVIAQCGSFMIGCIRAEGEEFFLAMVQCMKKGGNSADSSRIKLNVIDLAPEYSKGQALSQRSAEILSLQGLCYR